MTRTSIHPDKSSDRSRKNPPVRIRVTEPVRSDYFPGRWEDVSPGRIRLTLGKPVAPGTVIAVRTRSLLIRGRIQNCQHFDQKYAADAVVVDISPLGPALPVSHEAAGLLRLLEALEGPRG